MLDLFNRDRLIAQLRGLSKRQRFILGTILCERLVSNYKCFDQESGQTGFVKLRVILDSVWNQLVYGGPDIELCKQLLFDCESLIPSADEYSTTTVSMAIDAANALCVLLENMSEASPENLTEIFVAAVDTVDMYIQTNELKGVVNTGLEEERAILVHPLMQSELKRQLQDLEFVENRNFSEAGSVIEAQEYAKEYGGSIKPA